MLTRWPEIVFNSLHSCSTGSISIQYLSRQYSASSRVCFAQVSISDLCGTWLCNGGFEMKCNNSSAQKRLNQISMPLSFSVRRNRFCIAIMDLFAAFSVIVLIVSGESLQLIVCQDKIFLTLQHRVKSPFFSNFLHNSLIAFYCGLYSMATHRLKSPIFQALSYIKSYGKSYGLMIKSTFFETYLLGLKGVC